MEAIVGRILTKYFNIFFKNFDKKKFQLSTFGGSSVLNDMHMNEKALQEMIGIPQLEVVSCDIGRLEINFSVTRLTTQPITITIDRVNMVMSEPVNIQPLPSVVETALKKEDAADSQKEEKKKKGYGMGDKIADGIRVKIAVIAVEIRTLGHHKTEVTGPWTPPVQHLTIHDVMIEAVNAQWEVVDLKSARKSGKRQSDFDVFRRITIGGISLDLRPKGEDRKSIFRDLPLEIHITTRKDSKTAAIMASQTDIVIDSMQMNLNAQNLIWLMEIVEGLGQSMSRVSLEGDEFKATIGLLQGHELIEMNRSHHSDPFAVMHLEGTKADGRSFTTFEQKSRVIKKTLEPTWDESFEWFVNHPENCNLIIQLFDWDRVGKNRPMGFAKVPLSRFLDKTEPTKIRVPLEDVDSGFVEITVEVINWSKVIKPHPLKHLNVCVNKFSIELVEEIVAEGMVKMLGRTIKMQGMKGFGVQGRRLLLSTINPPVELLSPMQESTIQAELTELTVFSLDSGRPSSMGHLFRNAPRHIQLSNSAQTEIPYLPCTLRPKNLRSVPTIRFFGSYGDDNVEDSFEFPPLIMLRSTHRKPFPSPPNVGPEVEAILNPFEVTMDVVLLERLVAFLMQTIVNRPRHQPPDDILEEIKAQRKLEDAIQKEIDEQKALERKKMAEDLLKEQKPLPIFVLNMELVCALIAIPSPNRVSNPETPLLYLELQNVLVSSHESIPSPRVEECSLSRWPSKTFPADPSDFTSNADLSKLTDMSLHGSYIPSTKLLAKWSLMTVYMRPKPTSAAQKLADFFNVHAHLEFQLDLIIKALTEKLEERPKNPVMIGGVDIQSVNGEISQIQYGYLMYMVDELKKAGFSIEKGESPDPPMSPSSLEKEAFENDEKEKKKAESSDEDKKGKGEEKEGKKEKEEFSIEHLPEQLQKLERYDRMMSYIPTLIWGEIEGVVIVLTNRDAETERNVVVSKIDMTEVETMIDNNADRSVIKTVWKEMETFAQPDPEHDRLECISHTIMAPDFSACIGMRFWRFHGLQRIFEDSDKLGLHRGELLFRFGGVHVNGHLVDVIPILLIYFKEKLGITMEERAKIKEDIDKSTELKKKAEFRALELKEAPILVTSVESFEGRYTTHPHLVDVEETTFEDLLGIESTMLLLEKVMADMRADFEVLETRVIKAEQKLGDKSAVDDIKKMPIAIREDVDTSRKDVCKMWKEVTICNVYVEGWLLKRGTFVHSWKRRFHRLLDRDLYYFVSQESIAPLAVIRLKDCQFSLADYTAFHKPHTFQIQTQKDLFVFSCDSEAELDMWMEGLQEYKEREQDFLLREGMQQEGVPPGSGNDKDSESNVGIRSEHMEDVSRHFGEIEHSVRLLSMEKDRLFQQLPALYNTARDFRTDILQKQLGALVRERRAAFGELDRVIREKTEIHSTMERLHRRVGTELANELETERDAHRRDRMEIGRLRAELRVKEWREFVARGSEMEEWSKGKLKPRFCRVVIEKGTGRFGWGNAKGHKIDHFVDLGEIRLINFGAPAVSASDVDMQLRTLILNDATGKGRTLFFVSSSIHHTKKWVLGLQSYVQEFSPIPLKKLWTEGKFLGRRVHYRLRQVALNEKRAASAVLADAVVDMLQWKREGSEATLSPLQKNAPSNTVPIGKEEEEEEEEAPEELFWVKLYFYPMGSDTREVTVVDGRMIQSIEDIYMRVRKDLNLPVVPPSSLEEIDGKDLSPTLDLVVKFTDDDGEMVILTNEVPFKELIRKKKKLHVFQA
eukprot:TRINITY_DN347_c0_g2_i1.p1 TRINITY_DN347_c0_g2~~TRINITY_DN347_c0_g2_i1.p1  ORF type:complete len:1756 (+),score=511.91 TRINITY_DN347_c0_g2_i1:173-5440(+)